MSPPPEVLDSVNALLGGEVSVEPVGEISARSAIDLGIKLRRGRLSRVELIDQIIEPTGDPTNTFNGNQANEPTGGDPLLCSLPLAPR